MKQEVLLLLGLSLGASGVSSLISIIQKATVPGGLTKTVTLNPTYAPGQPWIDFAYHLYDVVFGVMAALMAWHLLARDHRDVPKLLGIDVTRPRLDLLTGAGLAALIGIPGLGLYWAARMLGVNATIQAEALPKVWWGIPMLVLAAIQNAINEEVVVVGYLTTRLQQIGLRIVPIIALSAALRGSYHLYQGVGGFIGNFVMGVIFAFVYRWWGRVLPLIIAHSILDIASFVGYDLLVNHWSFLR